MESVDYKSCFQNYPLSFAMASVVLCSILILVLELWIWPMKVSLKLKRSGFQGPTPRFPMGNLNEMFVSREKKRACDTNLQDAVTNDIYSTVFPYFARWRQSYGKVFVYWLGTEPFLYIGEPGFLKQVSQKVMAKNWGKPRVFKHDRYPMFGEGLVMVWGEDWVRHRHIIAPAFSSTNLKTMVSDMVNSTTKMLDAWSELVGSGMVEIDVEKAMLNNAAEIIAKTSFGISDGHGQRVVEKLRAMQCVLYKSNRLVGVPFSRFYYLKKTLEAHLLGWEIDHLLLAIIAARKAAAAAKMMLEPQTDLLGILLCENQSDGLLGKKLSDRELVDECKTFFFGGQENTGLLVSWTLLLLAQHPLWQSILREEIMQVTQGEPLNFAMLGMLEKMSWVMNEVLRLYPPSPNAQRQAEEDICIGDVFIPKGTNIWIDVVGMHHDPTLWGEDVNEFRPERFKDSLFGGCTHQMGFLPFGFGGRKCVGRLLSVTEYKVVLALTLTRFSVSVSPSYLHSPVIMLSLRPSHGIPLLLKPLM